MERWQEEIIRRNLFFLIKNIKCTIILLTKLEERNVLCPEDVQTVNAIATQFGKSDKLICLLIKKLNGFDIFIGVLMDDDVKQYAAAKLLLEERSKHYIQRGVKAPPPLIGFYNLQALSDIPTLEARLAIEFPPSSPSSSQQNIFLNDDNNI